MRKWIAALIGFGTMCPFGLTSSVNIRSNDVVAVLLVCAACAAVASSRRYTRPVPFAYFVIALLTIGWIGADLTFRVYMPQNEAATMILVRWIVAAPAAFYLALLCDDPLFRKYMIVGAVIGCLGTTALTAFDLAVFNATGAPAFTHDEARVTWVDSGYRPFGILGHPNGAAIGSLFIVPFLIGAAEEFGRQRLALIVASSTLCTVFYLTENRSAMIASVVLLSMWGITRRPALVVTGCASIAVVIGLIYLFDPLAFSPQYDDPGLFAALVNRFGTNEAMDDNAAGRMATTAGSLELALAHPFGMGSTYEAPLDQLAGMGTTHNALMQLALMGGIPLALLVTVLLGRVALKLFSPGRLIHQWVALYLLIVCMFEAIFYLPFFSLLILWVIARDLLPEQVAATAPEVQYSTNRVTKASSS
jgi:O-Antigen ligase